jgi:hypothetical protein
MSNVREIEMAIEKLTPDEVKSIADWMVSRRLLHVDVTERREILKQACGIWKDRTDLPDIRALRSGWDQRQ